MSDTQKLKQLLQRRAPGEVSKDAIVRAIRSYSVTQRVSEARREVRAQGWDITCRKWRKRDGRQCSAYRLVEAV